MSLTKVSYSMITGAPVNVVDYGASTSDSFGVVNRDAFQAALDSGASYVYVPSGTYNIAGTISIPNANVTLSGPDGGTQAYQCATINHLSTSTGPLFLVDSIANGGVCLRNFNVTGGNGSFCISSSRPYVRYEYIHMEPYNGGGIQLLSSGGGSSSSKIINCQWVAPRVSTNYTGFEISVNGGDVHLVGCTAIFGAIGVEIKQGQTIILDKCSLNKQVMDVITGGYSSATQFNTCAIKLSGSGYKNAISIKNCYIEAFTNGIYVESCQSLSITDNYITDGGVPGFCGIGNSIINLVDSNAKNITIQNNRFEYLANGTITDNYYGIYFNSAVNVIFANNYTTLAGSYAAQYKLTTSNSVTKLNNILIITSSTPMSSVDADHNINSLDLRNGFNNYSQLSGTIGNSWVDVVDAPNRSMWKVYMGDYITAGGVHTEATVQVDNSGTSVITYQIQTGAVHGEVQVSGGKIQVQSASATLACMYSVQRVI